MEVVPASRVASLTDEQLASYRGVVLLSTRGLERSARERLMSSVKNGGGLFIAAAPELEPAVLAEMTGWQPPLTVTEQVGPLTLAATEVRHPIFRPFGALAANLGQVRFDRAWRLSPEGWSVVARFSNGTPALVERASGGGRVLLFASDVDRRWNDFPLHPAFVPFALESLRYVAGDRRLPRDYTVAQAPSEAQHRPGVYRTADNRPFAVNVEPERGSARPDRSDGLRGHGATIGHGRRGGRRPAGAANRVTAELLAVWPGAHDCYTGCRIGGRARVTVHDQLRSLLSSVRRRWRAEVSLRAVGRGAALAAGPLLAGAGLAAMFAPGDRALMALAMTIGLLALAAVAASAWRVGGRPDDPRVARFVEERAAARGDVPPLDDVVVSAASAVQPAGGGQATVESTPFLDLVVESAVRRVEAIGAAGIVTPQALRRAGAEALAGVAMLAVAAALAWPMLARASEAAWIALVPQSIQVEVLPGDTRVAAGKPLTIRASVRAGGRLLTRFTPVLTVEALSAESCPQPGRRPDRCDDARRRGFSVLARSVDRTFRYRVTAGSRRSEDFTVTALLAPRVTRIDLHYEYPAYTSLAPREERDGGDIYAPAGTKVRVRVHADKPIASGKMVFAQATPGVKGQPRSIPAACTDVTDQVLEGELVLARDDSYRIRPDRSRWAPLVRRNRVFPARDGRPSAGRAHPASRRRPADHAARGGRDRGARRRRLRHRRASSWSTPWRDGEPKVVPFARGTGPTLAQAGTHTLAAEDLGVQPGDVITYYARARDVGRGKRPTETRSDMFFLEVRPFSEEFVAGAEPGHVGHGERADRNAHRRAERDHQRHLEHRAPRRLGRGAVGG